MKIDAIMIKEQDNVATALRDIRPNEKSIIGIGKKEKKALIKDISPMDTNSQ